MLKFILLFVLCLFSAKAFAIAPEPDAFFKSLNKDTMNLVTEFYASDAIFEDPVVQLKGSENIKKYYAHLYENLNTIQFDFSNIVKKENEVILFWKMTLSHKNLKGGEKIETIGNSYIKTNPTTGQAIYHRDYFDMGSFLYENLPVIGNIIRFIKSKVANSH